MKIGIEIGPIPVTEREVILPVLAGVLPALFAEFPEQGAVLFCTPENAATFSFLPSRIERVILPEERFFILLNLELKSRLLDVFFRSYPHPYRPNIHPSRQVVLIPDLRHEYFWEFFPQEQLEKKLAAFNDAMNRSAAIAVFSEFCRKSIETDPPLHHPEVFAIHPALDSDQSQATVEDLTDVERQQLPQREFFFYPAELEPHKNHRRLFLAFDRFMKRASGHFELILAGDPTGWSELSATFPNLPARHLGAIRPGFFQVLLGRTRALVYFSLYEGFCLPLLEAFRAGTPVVCGSESCFPEIVGDAALTCDPTNVEAMAEVMLQVARDEDVRSQLIARGRERLARFCWHDSARNLREVCRRVAEAAVEESVLKRKVRGAIRRARSLPGRCYRRAMFWIKSRWKRWLRPQLGVQAHYPPRPLVLPARYSRAKPPVPAPVISIVTPSFNQAIFLERTIQSVLGQNYPRLEYIVQDGGSSDTSASIINGYADRLTHWESAPDRGQAHAINLGFRHSSGEIMAYLNSDDLLLPGSLAYVARYFAKHPEVDVVYSHRVVVDSDDRDIGRCILPPHDNSFIAWEDFIPQETMFWRRRIWERVGSRIDENFHFALDWDLILRFRDAGARFVRLPRFLGAFRSQPEQKSLTLLDVYYPEVRRLRERCHGHPVSIREIARAHQGRFFRRQVRFQVLYALGLLQH